MSWQSRQKTKKAYKEKAIGSHITQFAFDHTSIHPEKQTGQVYVEGPYPVHRWYAVVDVDSEGIVRRVK